MTGSPDKSVHPTPARPVLLPAMPPAQHQAWRLLLRLDEVGVPWVLIGGQMMLLLAVEHGVSLPRPTLDADVLVDVRARPGGLEVIADWLEEQGVTLEGVSSLGVGHRFSRPADPGPGTVTVDLLAPEGLSERTRVYTVPPARTVSVPASSMLIADAVSTPVELHDGHRGTVHRPTVLAALVGKAAATTIAVRDNRERDWQDAALLLSLLPDPLAAADRLTKKERRRIEGLAPLRDPAHSAWRTLPTPQRRQGLAAAAMMLAP